jgi:hypothetical protein
MIEKLMRIFGSRTKALEILYLLHGIKPVVRQGFYDHEIGKVKDFCKENNLAIETAPYKVVLAEKDRRYSNKGFKVKVDDPRQGMYFVYISKDGRKAAMAEVFEYKNDHRSLGLLLGYPECCVDFFVKNEPVRSKLDSNYVVCTLDNSKGIRYPYFTNISKRHMDVTLLNHFPCSFNCERSIELAKKHLKLIAELDPNLAMKYANQLKSSVLIGKRFVEFC